MCVSSRSGGGGDAGGRRRRRGARVLRHGAAAGGGLHEVGVCCIGEKTAGLGGRPCMRPRPASSSLTACSAMVSCCAHCPRPRRCTAHATAHSRSGRRPARAFRPPPVAVALSDRTARRRLWSSKAKVSTTCGVLRRAVKRTVCHCSWPKQPLQPGVVATLVSVVNCKICAVIYTRPSGQIMGFLLAQPSGEVAYLLIFSRKSPAPRVTRRFR